MQKTSSLIVQHILWRGLYFFSVLVLNVFIARFFAAEKSGQLFYIVNNLSLILLLVSGSLESGAGYYLSSGKISQSAIARFCIVWAVIASLLAIGIWWFVLCFSHRMDLKDSHFLFATFLFIPGVLLTTYFTALFYAGREFVIPNKILLLVNLALVILFIASKENELLSKNLVSAYLSAFFIQGSLLMIFYFSNKLRIHKSFFPPPPVLQKTIQYSLAALMANVLYFLVNRVDYWFVAYYCSPKDLGNYIQASKLGQMLLILPGILGSTLFPILASQNKSGDKGELIVIVRILFFINGVMCVTVLCSGSYLFPLLFGSTFNEMYVLFALLIPGILSFTMNYPLAAWFSASNRILVNIWGALIALVVIFMGDILFIPRYGVGAASLCSSVGYFCYFAYSLHQYRKEHKEPILDMLLIRKSDLSQMLQIFRTKIGSATIENPPLIN